MASVLATVTLLLTFLAQTNAYPVQQSTITLKSERSWLWSWAWGAENKVSIVDRTPPVSFVSRPAAFGAELKQPLLGYVIPLSSFTAPCPTLFNVSTSNELPPNLGCPPLCISGSHVPDQGDTWIALVQRGECEFVNKVREAQRLGAHAVVVGGDNPDISGNPDTLVNMYSPGESQPRVHITSSYETSPGDSSDVKIPSTFIMYSDYKLLFTLIEASDTSHSGLRTLSLLITAEYSAWEWYSYVCVPPDAAVSCSRRFGQPYHHIHRYSFTSFDPYLHHPSCPPSPRCSCGPTRTCT
jgi:E3 ubiquitin-protein ligase RNF13/E3 ubiquitin-protein ligase RNF167